MRLIDGDSLMKTVFNDLFLVDGEVKSVGFILAETVDKAPTIDAVPAVRCRECKYWGDEDGKSQREDGVLFARCNVHNYLIDGRHTGWCPTENDFCSYGERKEGADNEP